MYTHSCYNTLIIRVQKLYMANCLSALLVWRMGRMSEAVALHKLHVWGWITDLPSKIGADQLVWHGHPQIAAFVRYTWPSGHHLSLCSYVPHDHVLQLWTRDFHVTKERSAAAPRQRSQKYYITYKKLKSKSKSINQSINLSIYLPMTLNLGQNISDICFQLFSINKRILV